MPADPATTGLPDAHRGAGAVPSAPSGLDTHQRSLPYGSWPAPISAADLAGGARSLSEVAVAGPDTYWVESDPGAGQSVLVRRSGDGALSRVSWPGADGRAEPVAVRTRVNEYGGGSYALLPGGVVLSAHADDRLYRIDTDGEVWAAPIPLVPEDGRRYADLEVDPLREVLYAVAEDHGGPGAFRTDPTTTLVSIPLDGSAAEEPDLIATLVGGEDFVAAPRLSPDGAVLAWITWSHPDMPWDAGRLQIASVTDGGARLVHRRTVAGGQEISVAEPVWTADGDLVHVDDRTGWWNLYRSEQQDGELRTRHLHPAEAEFTLPQWQLGTRTLCVLDDNHLMASYTVAGRRHLAAVRTANGALEAWDGPWQPVGSLAAGEGRVVFVGRCDSEPAAVVELDLARGQVNVLRSSTDLAVAPETISVAEEVSWSSRTGTAYGFFYPPAGTATGPEGELPPLLVLSHGGPTGAALPGFDAGIQFWTSRGFAVLDVNYTGSTGYGRSYRNRLRGRWGEVDVADCAAGAEALAQRGLVDGARMAIRGGSAGGFTTLAALTFTDTFAAGASYYGIGDLEALAAQTHKFESRYLDRLVGPYPDDAEVYRDRSPIHHVASLTAPMIIFQGEADRVVPPNQAEEMAAAVRAAGHEVEVHLFAGEGHGFRKAASTEQALTAELAFYGRVFGFTPA